MEIWIIRDGEKLGPFHDFEVRRKIESGELPATTPGWHEGLDAWKPLIDIGIFTREFENASAPVPLSDDAAPEVPRTTPPPLPVETFYMRRFWARWFDLSLYSGLWWLGMWAARQDIEAALLAPWTMFFHFVPWFALEILLIHYFSTTPGKWLLGLAVVNKDDSRLTLTASIHRAVRVLFTGIGFGWYLLAIFCQALSLFTSKRLGTTLWDHAGGHKVTARPLGVPGILATVAGYALAVLLQFVVVSPYTFEMNAKAIPALREHYKENPFWHLPKRSK